MFFDIRVPATVEVCRPDNGRTCDYGLPIVAVANPCVRLSPTTGPTQALTADLAIAG
jgi:hypothetical protein